MNTKTFVEVELPDALFDCLGEDFLLTLQTEMEYLSNLGSSNIYSNQSNAIEEAKSIIASVITCCDTGTRSNDCPNCIFDTEQNVRKLKQKGYVEIAHNGFEIETDAANVVTKLNFKVEGPQAGASPQLYTINYLDDIVLYSNSDQGNVFYQIDYLEGSCGLDAISSPLLGAYEYEEHTIVVHEDGAYRFFFKINTSISASFRSDSGERVLFPIVPMLIKRAVLGGFNVAAGLAVETVFKKWIDGHDTFYEAWENLEISYWNVFLDFAEGALSPNIPPYLQFGLDVFRNSLVYVLETGLYDFSFETFITTAAESAIQVSLLRLCLKALPAVGNKAGSAGRILKKNNPNTYNLIVSWVNNNPGRLYDYVSDITKPQPGQGYLSVFENIHGYIVRIKAWGVLSDDADLRKVVANLEKVDDHLAKNIHVADELEIAFKAASDKVKWIDDIGFNVLKKADGKVEYINPNGKVIKWTDQNPNGFPNQIDNSINGPNANAGTIAEGEAAQAVLNQKALEGFGIKRKLNGQTAGELDLVTADEIIEVKANINVAKNKFKFTESDGSPGQIAKVKDSSIDQYVNPRGKPVILYVKEPLPINPATNTYYQSDQDFIDNLLSTHNIQFSNSLTDLTSKLQ